VRCHLIVTGVILYKRAQQENSILTLLDENYVKLVNIASVYRLKVVVKVGNLGSG
jgi:hypothetical protein